MTRDTLTKMNKQALVEIILKLQEQNRLLKEKAIYTCMECGKEFEIIENNACPYCNSGDIAKEIINE